MYKLIALDLDGTLFNSKKEISERTKTAIHKAKQKGIKVVLATGRPLAGIKNILEELNLLQDNEYVLCFNGGLVVNAKTNEPIFECTLTGKDYKILANLAKELKVHHHAFSIRDGLITNENSQYTDYEAQINKLKINIINPQTDILDDDIIIKVMFIDPPEILAQAVEKMPSLVQENYNAFNSAPFFFEITNKQVDKGSGLEHLAKYLGISQSEVIACGDEANDYSMINYAGLGVAMGNGIEKVKAISDYITDTNDNDGIAKVIEKFILSK